MINIKCFFIRVYLLTYSPIFPMLLGSIIFITYRVYFEPVLLCDGNSLSLYELKTELYSEITKYNSYNSKIDENYRKLQELQKIVLPSNRNISLKKDYTDLYKFAISKYNESSTRINQLEAAIKIFEPGFKSPRFSK